MTAVIQWRKRLVFATEIIKPVFYGFTPICSQSLRYIVLTLGTSSLFGIRFLMGAPFSLSEPSSSHSQQLSSALILLETIKPLTSFNHSPSTLHRTITTATSSLRSSSSSYQSPSRRPVADIRDLVERALNDLFQSANLLEK